MTIFDPLNHTTLGFERFFDDIDSLLHDKSIQTQSYPPHNIIKVNDDNYVVELAVAGFSKDEIEIKSVDNKLIVKGEKKKDADIKYLHKGIGTRSFTKTLHIADTIKIRAAAFKDGILSVGLENVIPDHKKPRTIQIGDNLEMGSPELLQEEKAA